MQGESCFRFEVLFVLNIEGNKFEPGVVFCKISFPRRIDQLFFREDRLRDARNIFLGLSPATLAITIFLIRLHP